MPAESKHKSRGPGRCLSCSIFLIGVIAVAGLVVSIVTFVKLSNDQDNAVTETEVPPMVPAQNLMTSTPTAMSVPDPRTEAVVACYPERNYGQSECKKNGCKWLESNHPHVPSCVFDHTAGYLIVSNDKHSSTRLSATLKRAGLTHMYGMEVRQHIKVTVDMYGENMFRIHFAANDSWEIPDEALNINKPTGSTNKQYDVKFVTSPIFGVVVTRKSTGAVVFDTSVPGLIFTDQFVQISTRLPSPNLYGFGEHQHRRFKHDMNWRTWPIFTRDVAPVDEGINMYGAYPVYMNLEDDSKASMVFLKNSHGMDVVLQPDPYPAVTYKTLGGSLDFYVFMGPSPQQAVQQYTEAIGRPMMPPYWSLGFHLCRWGYQNLTEVENVVSRNLLAGIPQDVQWGDIDFMYKKFVFTVDKETFKGLPQFVDYLHSIGKKYIVIVDPGIGNDDKIVLEAANNSAGYNMYEDGKTENIYVKKADGQHDFEGEVWPGRTVFPDFTNPKTSSWYAKWIRYFRNKENVSVDGLWIDMNEPASFSFDDRNLPDSMKCGNNTWNNPPFMPHILEGNTGDLYRKTVCMDAKQYWGDHYRVHSLYGHSHAMATHAALKEVMPGKRPFIVTRSSYPGTSKYAAHWLGDNQSQWRQLPWSIVGILEFSMFGFSMIGADICGFYFETNYELCLRWMQVGAFYPFSRNHNARTDDDGKFFRDQDPASWNEEFVQITRHILLVRYKLLPYYYTLFHDAHQNGKTVARPLMFEFPEDKNTWNIDRQFLIGPAFMVTPVLEENKTTVDGYFPKARWFSYYDGEEVHQPGAINTFDAPLSVINIHMRGGHIIPMQEPSNSTHYSRQRDFSLAVNFDENLKANGHLFWDDGESEDTFKDGHYLMVHFNATKGEYLDINVIHDGYPAARTLNIGMIELFGLVSFPGELYIDGNKLPTNQVRFKFRVVQIVDLDIKLAQNHTLTWTVY
ncbi:sucrase-isomaltase, intestinal-like isoform X1 [Pecten maximus]|uniref:sucrase-isomaltase, intestinal-like isoform X1 n=2 Tax=Pecten maximus TaxID=6579 RepID=UPI00145887D7|nr:sucrase-isomaltase, intestinal-like isoform X1 [Pecten maximus]